MENNKIKFWTNRNVLVTGATGLLGSWLVEALLERGANVVALVRDWVPGSRLLTSGLYQKINVVRGDLEDHSLVLRALNEYEVNCVFHLGAQTIVGTAARSPLSTFEANIRGTWNLLEACRLCGKMVKRIVVASSDKAYGEQKLPYTEEMPLQGRFPYDVSKSCSDLIAFSYFYSYRLPVGVTRCGNLFGGGDLNFNRIVPGTIRSAYMDVAPVIRSDGKYIRDYIYVRDAVDAYLRLAENLHKPEIVGQAFNFGYQEPLSVLQLVTRILELMKKKNLEPLILNEAGREIREQYLDSSRAFKLLEWKPVYSLDKGLLETIDWYENWLSLADSEKR